MNVCEVIFLKKDKEDEIFENGFFWLIMLVILVLYIIGLCFFIWYPDRVFADQQIETRRFASGKVKVDGVEIAGTDRNFELSKGWEASVVQYDIRSYPSDTVFSYDSQAFDGFLRFLKGAKEKGYVTNKITFVVISKNGIVHEIKSGTKASFFDKNNRPIEFNLKKPWREFDGKTSGIYLVDGDYFKNLPHRPEWSKDDNTLGYWGLDVNTPKEVDGKLVPSGQRVQQFQSLSAIWGSDGYAPKDPTRDVLTQYSAANPPRDGVSHAYDYFKRSGDAVISNSVLVKENGQFLAGNKYENMKDKAKMSLNWVDVEVDDDAFEVDAKEKKQKEKQEKDKKKSEKDEKGKNWSDKLLSWLVYDEDFVKEQFNSVLAGAGAPEGTRVFEVDSNGGGVLYEWALNQSRDNGVNTQIYGGIEVLNQLGTGYTHAGYWQIVAKNFTKFMFTMTANYFIMKKFYKRLK